MDIKIEITSPQFARVQLVKGQRFKWWHVHARELALVTAIHRAGGAVDIHKQGAASVTLELVMRGVLADVRDHDDGGSSQKNADACMDEAMNRDPTIWGVVVKPRGRDRELRKEAICGVFLTPVGTAIARAVTSELAQALLATTAAEAAPRAPVGEA